VAAEENIWNIPGRPLGKGPASGTLRLGRLSRGFLVAGVSAVCLFYIWRAFEWRDILIVFRQGHVAFFFVGSILSILAIWLLRALRWHLLLRTVRATNADFLAVYICTTCSLGLSVVTPVQSGEALKVEMLKKISRVERVKGYGCFAVERMLDLLCVWQLAFFGVVLGLGREIGLSPSMIGTCAALIFVVAFLAAYASTRFGPWRELFASMLGTFKAQPLRLFVAWLLSSLAWCVTVIAWGICLGSVGIRLSIPELGLLTSVVTLVNILSLIPGAVGISEVSTSIALTHFGVPEVKAQAGALVLRAYALIILLWGLLHVALFYLINLRAKATRRDTEN
jgi:uncharacterized membrane protein YbhN (UPF0104 family)